MGTSQSPPDGWIVNVGTWGTDAASANSSGVGGGGVLMGQGATSTLVQIVSAWIPMDQSYASIYYSAQVSFYMIGNTNYTMNFVWYDATKKVVKNTANVFTGNAGGVASTVNQQVSAHITYYDTTAPWGRWEISKAATGAGQLTMYRAHLEMCRPALTAIEGTNTAAVVNTWTNVTWAAQTAIQGRIDGGNLIGMRKGGMYLFTVNLTLAATATLTAGTIIQSRLYNNTTSAAASPTFITYSAVSGEKPRLSWSHLLEISSLTSNVSLVAPYIIVQYMHNFTGTGGMNVVAGDCSLGVSLLT